MTGPSNVAVPAIVDVIVDVIVDRCDPDRIVLFGSWAKGTNHRLSDVDLLVVGPFTASAWIRDREVREALRELPVRVDLHLVTPDELAVGTAKAHSYLNTLFETSREVYRRA